MKNEIISKINRHVSKGLTEEADVVYLIVELWKIIEFYNSKTDYPTLKFYRDWVVHAKLHDVKGSMKNTLDRFEAIIEAKYSGTTNEEINKKIKDILSLRKLGNEINRLFDSNSEFQRNLVGKPEEWLYFGGLIFSILADIPLIADKSYTFIQELRLLPSSKEGDMIFQITLKPDRKITIPLNAKE